MRESTEGIEISICTPVKAEHARHVYLFSVGNKWFIVFDPGYEYGFIHIYEQVNAISAEDLRKKYPQYAKNREALLHAFIKNRFRVECQLDYELVWRCDEFILSKVDYEFIRHILERSRIRGALGNEQKGKDVH